MRGAAMSEQIKLANMCDTHQRLLLQQAGYSEKEAWRALIVVSQVALFQAATCDDRIHKRIGGDLSKLQELGCLACLKPDSFGSIVEVAKGKDLGKIKALAEGWIKADAQKAKQ